MRKKTQESQNTVTKVETGIPGFDLVANGGLPRGRTTLLAGSAGSAKTVFAAQYLAEGIRRWNQPGVFVTFEEKPEDIRRNMLGLGWNIAPWEDEGLWTFVDGTPDPSDDVALTGGYDFGGLLARIEHAVKSIGAERVVMDSLGAVFTQFADSTIVRRELLRAAMGLRRLGVTALLTAERSDEYGPIARYGVEEFVADNVIILRNIHEDEKRRRTVEILKFRGTMHQKGEWPFTIIPDIGIVALPLSALQLKQRSTSLRVSSGNDELDAICHGGFFRDSIVLVSGATGTGKTLLCTEFIAGGAKAGERCLIFAFEESHDQLFRNAEGWGFDFESLEQNGKLRVVCAYPESAGLEDHLINMRSVIEEFNPDRVAVDSLSALERVSTGKGFREFIIGLTSFIKHRELVGLFTSTTESLIGGTSITEAHISTITDSIILLRYVELYGEMRRGLTVLKMRGSAHDKQIREFTIDGSGMHIGNPFREVHGIIAGTPMSVAASETKRISELFQTPEQPP